MSEKMERMDEAIDARADIFARVLSALIDLEWYCHHHEGWQDDHAAIVAEARAAIRVCGGKLKEE